QTVDWHSFDSRHSGLAPAVVIRPDEARKSTHRSSDRDTAWLSYPASGRITSGGLLRRRLPGGRLLRSRLLGGRLLGGGLLAGRLPGRRLLRRGLLGRSRPTLGSVLLH